MDELVEYEMDEPDMVFITQTLPGLKIQIAEDKFEKIVDRLEKESYKLVITGAFPHHCSMLRCAWPRDAFGRFNFAANLLMSLTLTFLPW